MEQKNFGLTEESFNKLVEDLKKNDTYFFEQVFLKQFKETMTYLKVEYKAAETDAYDATMDALLEFRQRFVSGKLAYGNLRFLFTKMASQMLLKSQNKALPTFEGTVFLEAEDEYEPLTNQEQDSFNKAWESLGDSCKELLTWHFYGNKKLTEIAEMTQKNAEAIRKQKERCLKALKDSITDKKQNNYEK